MDPLIGREIGPYVITEWLGEGGMAVVYKAHQPSLHRYVAIKILTGILARDEELVKRFRREAVAAGSLGHPNILTIYDAGTTDDGLHYIVMELSPGGTLKDLMQQGRLPVDRACEIAAQVGDALQAAHDHGIVHRDLKPSNILMASDGRPLLMDFGVALTERGPRLTRTGMAVGTPEYMSPEQAQGRPTDSRSDIYAFGVLVYEMLTGDVPFYGETPVATLYRHVHETAPDLSEFPGVKVPAWLARIVETALAKQPDDRYQTAQEMAAALRSQSAQVAAKRKPSVSRKTVRREAPVQAEPDKRTRVGPRKPPAALPPAPKKRRRRRRGCLIAFVIFMAIVCGGLYAVSRVLEDLQLEDGTFTLNDFELFDFFGTATWTPTLQDPFAEQTATGEAITLNLTRSDLTRADLTRSSETVEAQAVAAAAAIATQSAAATQTAVAVGEEEGRQARATADARSTADAVATAEAQAATTSTAIAMLGKEARETAEAQASTTAAAMATESSISTATALAGTEIEARETADAQAAGTATAAAAAAATQSAAATATALAGAEIEARETADAQGTATAASAARATESAAATATAEDEIITIDPEEWDDFVYDDFSTDQGDWPTGAQDSARLTGSQHIVDGSYRWEAEAKSGFIWWTPHGGGEVEDFALDILVAQLHGSIGASYGAMFRHDEQGNHYIFQIRDSGEYQVALFHDGTWTNLIDWTPSPTIFPGESNYITVLAEGPDFSFWINDELVDDMFDSTLARGDAGLIVGLANEGDTGAWEFYEYQLFDLFLE